MKESTRIWVTLILVVRSSMWSRKFLSYSTHCWKRKVHLWFRGKKTRIFNKLCVTDWISCCQCPFILLSSPIRQSNFIPSALEEQVLEPMKGVDISKVCGHDEIGNKIIILCSEGFHVYFTPFINLYHSLGHYPRKWKLANVIPLFKNDNRQGKVNHRPVTLREVFSKICKEIPVGFQSWRLNN